MKTIIGYIIATLIPLLYLLNLSLSHIWHDKRTKKYKRLRQTIIAVIIILALVNIINFYLIKKSNDGLIDVIAKEEKQNKILVAVERMSCIISSENENLEKKYPMGYYLFTINKFTTVPANPEINNVITLDYENTKIIKITDKSVDILLKELIFKPRNNRIADMRIGLRKSPGTVVYPVVFGNIVLCVELLDIRDDNFVFVIGFKKIQSSE